MDTLIELLNYIEVTVMFTLCEHNAYYDSTQEEFTIVIDPTSEYDVEMLLKHEFIHALQHEYNRNGVKPFPIEVWRDIKPPAYFVKRALSEYKIRYSDKDIDVVELQAMALETMPVKVLVEIYKYIVDL